MTDAVTNPVAAIVLAGGTGERLGGIDKAAIEIGGRTLLDRALAAVGGLPTVVVGPTRLLPAGVAAAREDPAGGGPAAGVVAGFAALERRPGVDAPNDEIPSRALILLLAVDHPGVTPDTFSRLVSALRPAGVSGAVLVAEGRRQYGIGVYSAGALRWSRSQRRSWHGVPLRSLLGALVDAEVPAVDHEADDIDSPEDLVRWRSQVWPPR